MHNFYEGPIKPTVLVTGAKGLVGTAIRRLNTDFNIVYFDNKENIDLREKTETLQAIRASLADVVIHCASRVAGLGGHVGHHADFLNDNLLINSNVTWACATLNKKLIALSSVAAFPGNLTYLTEDSIGQGDVHGSEFGYALSKRLLDTQIQLYRKENNSNFCCVFPTNVYGPEDNFSLKTGHVIPSLIHKFYNAIKNHEDEIKMWGDGLSLRQFIYVDDLAEIILALCKEETLPDRMICSRNVTYSIKDVVETVADICQYDGVIFWDNSQQKNGLRVRECDNSRMRDFCSKKEIKNTSLFEGIGITWNWFVKNYESARK